MHPENQGFPREYIPLAAIRRDDSIQPREQLNDVTVMDYTDLIREGEGEFPPVVVFREPGEDSTYLLADGFHRIDAAEQAGENTVFAEIRDGTREDAMRYACGANSRHGLPLTNADKNRVVNRMLDSEQSKPAEQRLSQRDLARHCGVTQAFVSKLNKRREADNRYHPPALLPDEVPVSITYSETTSVMAHGNDMHEDVFRAEQGSAPGLSEDKDLASAVYSKTASVMAHGNGMHVPMAAHASLADATPTELADAIVAHVMDYLRQLTGVSASLVEAHFLQAVAAIQSQIRSLSNLSQQD